jgi:catalase-peroxidase
MTMKNTPIISAVAMALSLALCQGSAFANSAPANVAANDTTTNQYWWPEQLNLAPLRQHAAESNPYGADYDYAKQFQSLDLAALEVDLRKVLTTSQDWWPADYGHYGPFFVRMAWHSAGVYRIFDGRGGANGGQQRFEPLNSWPDNVNLDKARRLLWPIKQKYGSKISWADLMVLAGNVAMEDMGFKTFGFAGGRTDDWQAEQVNWGSEKAWLDSKRRNTKGELAKPMGATQMGLIYVNPEGPNGVPDPLASAQEIRDTFGRMAMTDEETVALIAGGHTFGKAHGARDPKKCVGVDPGAAGLEAQGTGWKNTCGKGHSEDTTSSGLEGAWSVSPTKWTMQYLDNLYAFEWVKSKSPTGHIQWIPANGQAANLVPDAHIPGKRHAPIMFTTDIALKEDPIYREITTRFRQDPKAFELAFAKAWFKLTHRDMGPATRYLGNMVPTEAQIWQDPIPKVDHPLIGDADIAKLKGQILATGLTHAELIRTAWAAAASFRGTDLRGGANGGRLRLDPQKDWAVNNPKEIAKVLAKLEKVQKDFNSAAKKVSLADLIVLGGNAAIEQAAKAGGYNLSVPFTPGRMDASQAQTDAKSFAVLEPKADAFRNYFSADSMVSPTEAMVEKAYTLNLTVPEMTVLLGGLRALDANTGGVKHGVFTAKPGALTNDFFVNLLDMATRWEKSAKHAGLYEGFDRKTGKLKWTATPVDLVFGSHAELRAVAEVYAANDAKDKFAQDFVKAWTKVMQNDRFDVAAK